MLASGCGPQAWRAQMDGGLGLHFLLGRRINSFLTPTYDYTFAWLLRRMRLPSVLKAECNTVCLRRPARRDRTTSVLTAPLDVLENGRLCPLFRYLLYYGLA